MPEETVQPQTFDQAAEAARAQLTQESQKAVEQSADDTKAATTETSEQTQPETQTEEPGESEELLTKDELATLDAKAQANYKKMQKAYTQRTQKLSAREKEIERLLQHKELFDAFEQDPAEVIRQLAPQYGLSLAEAAKTQEPAKESVATDAAQGMQTELRQLLGAGNEEFADGLAKVFESRLNKVQERVQQTEERQNAQLREAAAASTDADLKAFETKHPDFKTHEKAMLELSRKIQPNPSSGMDVDDYMELLYSAVTANAVKTTTKTEQTREVIERINKAAAKAEPQTSAVTESRITPARPKRPTMEEAFEAANKGIAW